MGGGVADRPEEDNKNSNNSPLPSFGNGDSEGLPIEKQFTHMMFCQHIQNITLPEAKQLLADLHMLYLSQQFLVVKMAKQEFLR